MSKSKTEATTKTIRRKTGNQQRMTEVLMTMSEGPTLVTLPSEVSESVSDVLPPKKRKRTIPNKRIYQLDELISTVKLINEGKSMDEMSKLTGRSPASLLYKYHSPRGLLGIRNEEEVREWWKARNPD